MVGLDVVGRVSACPVPAYVERHLRRFLEYGIPAHGFAWGCCEKLGRDFLVTYSGKGRGVCAFRNTRRLGEMAAHMGEHVFSAAAALVQPWVVEFLKRVRHCFER